MTLEQELIIREAVEKVLKEHSIRDTFNLLVTEGEILIIEEFNLGGMENESK